MARLNSPKRLIKEDFDEKDQELIDKLAYSVNSFYDEVYSAFNKNIDINNLSREIVTITVENGTGGDLKIATQFRTVLKNRIIGFHCIRADNITNPAIYPTNCPFLSWTINENIITIKKVTGIQDNNKYTLTLEIIS